MTLADLSHLLKLGLGRAIRLVRQHYDPSCRDVILNACLHNLSWDAFSEGSRSRYMFDVIEATGEPDFYRAVLLPAIATLDNDENHFDMRQCFYLAVRFAGEDDEAARPVIVDRLTTDPAFGEYAAADALIWLEGFKGFVFAARQIDAYFARDPAAYRRRETTSFLSYLVYRLKNRVGEAKAERGLELMRDTDPDSQRFMAVVDRKRRSRSLDYGAMRYTDLRQRVQRSRQKNSFFFRMWGGHVSDSDFPLVAADLLTETRTRPLLHLLNVFQRAPFPGDPQPIIELARGHAGSLSPRAFSAASDETRQQLVDTALRVLSELEDPAVRAFALESIERGYQVGWMTRLLERNFRDGDWARVAPLTADDHEEMDQHQLGFGILDFARRDPSPFAAQALIDLYEQGLCADCRERFVRALIELKALPDWMREECLLDSNLKIRDLVAEPKDQEQVP